MSSYLPLCRAPSTTVIFDTDFCGDVDDVGALAILCAASRTYGFKLGGVAVNVNGQEEHDAVAAVLERFGFFDTGIGVFDGRRPDVSSPYTVALAQMLPCAHRETWQKRTARELYRSVLEQAADGSVVVISVGFFPNLDEVYAAYTDLFLKKVRAVVLMAGGFERQSAHREYNIEQMLPEATHFLNECKAPLYFSGFECGDRSVTDLRHVPRAADAVVMQAYRLFTKGEMLRPSWDLIATDFAVRGECDLYALSESGVVRVASDATTRFEPSAQGNARYLKFRKSDEQMGEYITEALLSAILPDSPEFKKGV